MAGNEGLSRQVSIQENSLFSTAWEGIHNNIHYIFDNLATNPRRQNGGQYR